MTLKIEFQNCSPKIRQRVKNLLTTNDFEQIWEAGKPIEKGGVDYIVKFKYKENKNEVD